MFTRCGICFEKVWNRCSECSEDVFTGSGQGFQDIWNGCLQGVELIFTKFGINVYKVGIGVQGLKYKFNIYKINVCLQYLEDIFKHFKWVFSRFGTDTVQGLKNTWRKF